MDLVGLGIIFVLFLEKRRLEVRVVIRQVSQNAWETPLGVLEYGWWVRVANSQSVGSDHI